MKCRQKLPSSVLHSVAPARERGLKWINTRRSGKTRVVAPARERGLKFTLVGDLPELHKVAPARERGLK